MALLLTETVLFYWNFLNESHRPSVKDNFSGVGDIEDWADKIISAKPVHTLLSQCSRGHGRGSRHGRTASITTSSSLRNSRVRKGTPASAVSSNTRASTGPPPSKRARTSASQHLGSGAHDKYINSDLPAGATDNNVWRRVFISTLANLASTYENVWIIPDKKLQLVLQTIWDLVYKTIPHTVNIGGPVYYISKQALNNWRGGFASAAIAVIATFFSSDHDFMKGENHVAFAEAMRTRHRFSFSNNRGTDHKAWTGLWRSLFVLQTFAHHYNDIQGYKEVEEHLPLGFQQHGTRGALVLACAALYCVLTLIANNTVTFHPAESVNALTLHIPKGSQYEFSENIWGATTQQYLAPIQELTDKQFDLVVNATLEHIMASKAGGMSMDMSVDDDFDSLYAFR